MIYGGSGVCRVEAVGPGGKDGRLHYTLCPLHQNYKIMTPVDDQKVFMRPVITRDEARALIGEIPTIQALPFHSRIQRELAEHYETRLKTYDCRTLLELTMSIHTKREAALAQKKRLGAVDETFLRRAEDLLFSELAVALGIPEDQVQPYIQSQCQSP